MDSPVFVWLSQAIDSNTSLSTLESRGTVRIVLKEAGLDPKMLSPDQADVILAKTMPSALASRGVEGAEQTCSELRRAMSEAALEAPANSPDAIFARLGG